MCNFMNQIEKQKDGPFYEANFVFSLCILCSFAFLYTMFHALLFRFCALRIYHVPTKNPNTKYVAFYGAMQTIKTNRIMLCGNTNKQRMDHFMKQTCFIKCSILCFFVLLHAMFHTLCRRRPTREATHKFWQSQRGTDASGAALAGRRA